MGINSCSGRAHDPALLVVVMVSTVVPSRALSRGFPARWNASNSDSER
jgi:hypothetical protein